MAAATVLRRTGLILAPWVAIVLLWYAVAYCGLINPALVPTPHRVAARFWELLTEQRLPRDIWMSTQRVFIGVALGIVLRGAGRLRARLVPRGAHASSTR